MKFLLMLGGVIALPSFAASGGDLDSSDLTGVSFWLVTAALLAATVFFFVERDQVSAKWKTLAQHFVPFGGVRSGHWSMVFSSGHSSRNLANAITSIELIFSN